MNDLAQDNARMLFVQEDKHDYYANDPSNKPGAIDRFIFGYATGSGAVLGGRFFSWAYRKLKVLGSDYCVCPDWSDIAITLPAIFFL